MTRVEPAFRDDFEDVVPLLEEFPGQRLPREAWYRMLFEPPWPTPDDRRGYVLRDDGRVVGFLGTISCTREIRSRRERFCNLSSWIVRDSHRGASLQLVLPVLADREQTIVNLTASAAAHEVFRALGFTVLEREQVLIPPFTDAGRILAALQTRLVMDRVRVREELVGAARERFDHHADTHAAQLLVGPRGAACHIVATSSPWRGRWRLAHLQYASDWTRVWEALPRVAWGCFRTLGTVGLRVDARRAPGRLPPNTRRRALALPTLYRPAHAGIRPEDVDGLYSELVLQPR